MVRRKYVIFGKEKLTLNERIMDQKAKEFFQREGLRQPRSAKARIERLMRMLPHSEIVKLQQAVREEAARSRAAKKQKVVKRPAQAPVRSRQAEQDLQRARQQLAEKDREHARQIKQLESQKNLAEGHKAEALARNTELTEELERTKEAFEELKNIAIRADGELDKAKDPKMKAAIAKKLEGLEKDLQKSQIHINGLMAEKQLLESEVKQSDKYIDGVHRSVEILSRNVVMLAEEKKALEEAPELGADQRALEARDIKKLEIGRKVRAMKKAGVPEKEIMRTIEEDLQKTSEREVVADEELLSELDALEDLGEPDKKPVVILDDVYITKEEGKRLVDKDKAELSSKVDERGFISLRSNQAKLFGDDIKARIREGEMPPVELYNIEVEIDQLVDAGKNIDSIKKDIDQLKLIGEKVGKDEVSDINFEMLSLAMRKVRNQIKKVEETREEAPVPPMRIWKIDERISQIIKTGKGIDSIKKDIEQLKLIGNKITKGELSDIDIKRIEGIVNRVETVIKTAKEAPVMEIEEDYKDFEKIPIIEGELTAIEKEEMVPKKEKPKPRGKLGYYKSENFTNPTQVEKEYGRILEEWKELGVMSDKEYYKRVDELEKIDDELKSKEGKKSKKKKKGR